MNRALVLLTLRRVLHPLVLLAFVALASLVTRTRWTPDPELAGLLAFTGGLVASPADLAREGTWSALLLAFGPYLVGRAAGSLSHWRRAEIDAVAASGLGRARFALSTWAGHALAAAALVVAAAVAAELAAGGARPELALRGIAASTGHAPIGTEPDAGRRIEGELEAGDVLRLRIAFFGGGPAPDLSVELAREEGGERTELELRVGARRVLDVDVPPGKGPLRLRLSRSAPGALLAVEPDGIELLARTGPDRLREALDVPARAWLALVAALSLALGFGAWFSAPTAFLAVLAVVLPALWTQLSWARLLPWPQLERSLAAAGEGVRLAAPPAAAWAAALAGVALGLTLTVSGLASWRRSP